MAKRLYTLEVVLAEAYVTEEFAEANPVVSRTIEMRGSQTLEQLHKAIFRAHDRWDDCHLCEFQFGEYAHDPNGDRYVMPFIFYGPPEFDEEPATGSVDKTRLDDMGLEVGRYFGYWYDFGDNWYHRIWVVAIGGPVPKRRYPRVIARVGESPPQYPPEEEYDEDEE